MNSSSQHKSKVKTLNTADMGKAESKMPSFGGISLPEIAVLGAAGFVLWKNRAKISSLLENNGINVPTFLNSDLTDIIQSGVSMIENRGTSPETTSRSRRHDA